jgi:hypothetical protein
MNAFRLPKFPQVTLPKVDLPKIDLPKVDLPKIDFPKFDPTKMALPGLDLTHLDVRKGVERVATLSKDLAYVTVGTGVLAVQQMQVRRRELTASLQARIPDEIGKVVSSSVDAVRSRLRPPADTTA